MVIGRIALALALFGPILVGLIAPIVSGVKLRRRPPTVSAAFIALIIWGGLCGAVVLLAVRLGFAYAWMWAHARRDGATPPSELGLLAMVCGGLLLLGGVASVLHRIVRPRPVA